MNSRRIDTLMEKLDLLETYNPQVARNMFDRFLDEARRELSITKMRLGPEGMVAALGPVTSDECTCPKNRFRPLKPQCPIHGE